jgi:hypothetical protein
MKSALFGVLLLASATSFAGYDKWECNTNNQSFKTFKMECISCGIQQYYQTTQQRDVLPSEKWLSLLAMVTKSTTDIKGSVVVDGSEAQQTYQAAIIQRIQAYGLCTKYLGKKHDKITSSHVDMTATEWNQIYKFTIGKDDQGVNAIGKISESMYGFKSPGFDSLAKLFPISKDGDKTPIREFEDMSVSERTEVFRKALDSGLSDSSPLPQHVDGYPGASRGYASSSSFIDSDDKGLRDCLTEIKTNQNAVADSAELCNTMKTACDIPDKVMTCGKGSGAAAKAPAPGDRQIPPPPPPGGSGHRKPPENPGGNQ